MSAGAAGAAALSEAGAAGASAAGAAGAGALSVAAGGAAAESELAASCFAQAVSISAATSALRASLVFIDRYPEEKQEWCENATNDFFSFRESCTDRVDKFYRVPGRFETVKRSLSAYNDRRPSCLCPPGNATSPYRTAIWTGTGQGSPREAHPSARRASGHSGRRVNLAHRRKAPGG